MRMLCARVWGSKAGFKRGCFPVFISNVLSRTELELNAPTVTHLKTARAEKWKMATELRYLKNI